MGGSQQAIKESRQGHAWRRCRQSSGCLCEGERAHSRAFVVVVCDFVVVVAPPG